MNKVFLKLVLVNLVEVEFTDFLPALGMPTVEY